MRGPPDKIEGSVAITLIQECAQTGVQIFAVEGFIVVAEGYIAALDLILDLGSQNLTIKEAAAEAEAFVRSKARPDVLWEVWTEVS